MFNKILIAVAGSMIAMSAFAVAANQVEKSIQLKDGSTVYVFNDGKMGMENKFGRATDMAPGHVMETKAGEKIVMTGNEVARTHSLLTKQYVGG
jgi:predicted lipoprotein with Yx(FWY)xxD motif